MLPVGEFKFVVGGLATFAASVGYAFSRRLIADLPRRNTAEDGPDQSESIIKPPPNTEASAHSPIAHEEPALSSETSHPTPATNVVEDSMSIPPLSRRPSLKRKRSLDDNDDISPDAGYPHNLASIYPPPKKRSRTPSADEKNDIEKPANVVEGSCPPNTTPVVDDAVENQAPAVPSPEPGVSLPSPPRTPKPSPRKASEPLPTTPAPVFGTPVAMPSSPRTPLPSRTATVNAFSAFSGTASPFASFSASSPSRTSKPVWTSENTASGSSIVPPNQVSTSNEDDSAGTINRSPESCHALEAVSASKSTVEYLTGEEDEDVELELKGVKLFVKRGDKPFSDGVVGHVKLLSSKTTLDERLLFRREPLWKVSMNVRMHPTVHCTYEAEEHVVRIILQELVEQPYVAQEDWKREIVVYALRPGRSCLKQDFKDFATSLVECIQA